MSNKPESLSKEPSAFDVVAFCVAMLAIVTFVVRFGHWTQVILVRESIEDRCLSYFLHNFESFDSSPEICAHIARGVPLKPYQFGQEFSSFSSSR